MPIDLPPSLPPQVGNPDVLETRYEIAQKNTIDVRIASQLIRISGNSYLNEKTIRKAAAAVDTPAQFIKLLDALYAAEGYPFVNVEYGREDDSGIIYIDISQGYIERIDAPPLLQPFFNRFQDVPNLQFEDFHIMQVLAGIKADRAGVNVSSEYTVSEIQPDEYVLDLDIQPDPEHEDWTLATSFGNPGNRFLGRYFGFASVQYNTPNGDILGLTYGRSFSNLGEPRGGRDYNYGQFKYSTVNPTGLYSFSVSYAQYILENQFGFQETQRTHTVTVSLDGSQLLHATASTRLLLNETLEYIDSATEVIEAPVSRTLPGGLRFPVQGQQIRDLRYATAKLGLTLSHSWQVFSNPTSVEIRGSYERGFAGEIDNLVQSNRQTNFNLFAGRFELSYRLFWDIVSRLTFKGQVTLGAELPQQQQWVLGGPGELSAFLPGILIGDNGSYGRFDLIMPPLSLGPSNLRLTFFVEAGNAVYADRTGSDAAVRAAADAGVKLELDVGEWLDMSVYHAESLGVRNFEVFPGEEFVEDNTVDWFFNVTVTL